MDPHQRPHAAVRPVQPGKEQHVHAVGMTTAEQEERMNGRAVTCTWDDLDELRGPWRETFGEDMPYGFEVNPCSCEIMAECLRTKIQRPLDAYIEALPPDISF